MAKFKQEILDKIKSDPDLFAAVAKAMNLMPTSLPKTIERNGNNLNRYDIVALVAAHLNEKPEDLLEEDAVKESQS